MTARTPEHQPILMESSLKAPMLGIGHSMVLKLSEDHNKIVDSKAFDDINVDVNYFTHEYIPSAVLPVFSSSKYVQKL